MTKNAIVAFASVLITTAANVGIWLAFCANMKRRFDSLERKMEKLSR
jgi:hypothetical protein